MAEDRLLAEVRRRLAHGTARGEPVADVERAVREAGAALGAEDIAALAARVGSATRGAGPLQRLLDEPGVSDVLVDGTGRVWADRGSGLEERPVDLGGADQIRALAVRLAAAGGSRLDDAAPLVDARLPDGTRLHAVLPPIAVDGPLLSLRVLRRSAYPLDALVRSGSVAPVVAATLVGLVRNRANVLVSGATGTGKTTLLAALLALVPPDERVVCLEESGELDPDHPHVVRLVARRPNVEGVGEVDLARLVREALRMRPDRIVLGECRGAEVREVLAALSTGHEGSWATLHATAAQDVPARLEAMAALAGMSREAVVAQAGAALDAVVHLRRDAGRRRVAQIGRVLREGAALRVEEVVAVGADGTVRTAPGWEGFVRRWGGDPAASGPDGARSA
ncbi:TadA family conjugal transfer-associated ATPase [Actinotalea sp.]|uniref:TadA family conjugal transfer-associated ATPase n=1 Tax=Actinotalea sp. TaxID=1872145 RepID=UPI0035677288